MTDASSRTFAAESSVMPPSASWSALRRGLTGLALWASALGLAGGTLATAFARDSWRLDIFTHFRPHLFVLALAVMAVALMLRRWRPALLAVAAAAINGAVLLAPVHAAPLTATGPAFRLIAFNVMHDNTRYDALEQFVSRQHPDVLVLEETLPSWQRHLGILADALPFQTELLPHGRQDVAILSRWPITDFSALQPVGPTGAALPFRIARAELDADGRKLVVYGVHPPHPMNGWEWRTRNAYFAWLARRMAQEPKDAAVVVAGDFNSTLWSPFFRDYLAVAGVTDAARSNWPAPTRHPYVPDGWRWIGIPIDHVTVSPAVGITGFAVGPELGSDHYPVIADLRLPR
jgi:endonuclease/exonuclease/phosphatase (EEP) superfamily protein YafD